MADANTDNGSGEMTPRDPEHKSGKMTDHEQAKHAFAMHQDNMLWSRLAVLALVQGAVLAGGYGARADLPVVRGLMIVGLLLTALVGLTMWRDDNLGEAAFGDSRVPKTHPKFSPWWFRGLYFALAAFVVLVGADLFLWWHLEHLPQSVVIPPAAP